MSIRKTLARTAIAAGICCALYAALVIVRFIPGPFACLTETEMRLQNLSGMNVEVTYTNCDTLAKDESISVYASPSSANGEPFWVRLLRRKTLLFRYDPGRFDNLPAIKANGEHATLISNPRIAEIFYQSRKWNGVTVDYQIGKVDYPGTGTE